MIELKENKIKIIPYEDSKCFEFSKYVICIVIIIVLAFSISEALKAIAAGNANKITPFPNSSSSGFIENKGQFYNQDYKPNPDVLYLFSSPGFNLQLRRTGFSYDTYTMESHATVVDESAREGERHVPQKHKSKFQNPQNFFYRFHRIDVEFLGANFTAPLPEDPFHDYFNYYNPVSPAEGIINVRHFRKITYTNIYPDIDLVFYVKESESENKIKPSPKESFKFDFIVHRGGKVEDIALQYKGQHNIYSENGKLFLRLSAGTLEEQIPVSYLRETGKSVHVKYHLNAEGRAGFKADNYPDWECLIIDPIPNLLWGTYYGDAGNEYSYGITADLNNNVLITGETFSASAIATSGAYQSNLGGGVDAFIAKFNPSGVRQWGTYFGGTGNDSGYGIDVDGSNNILLSGWTNSDSVMATPGAHQTAFGGGLYDAFIAKFDSSGIRQWSTYYGDADDDYGYGIAADNNNNILVNGKTTSASGIATSGAYQTVFGGGEDAFILKLNVAGVRQWATYYGGSGMESSWDVDADANNNAYVIGETSSATGIASVGAHQTGLSGSSDAFVVKFNSSGARQWGTYFGGSADETGYGLAVDNGSNPVITGFTLSASGISTAGTHQPNIGGSGDAYIVKFNAAGVRQWGTYYGGLADDQGYAIAADVNSNILVTGPTSSSSGIASAGTYQINAAGNYDAFVAKLDSAGNRLWGTYYGGSEEDKGWSIASDNNSNVLVMGYTLSTSGISTPGAHQPNYGGGILNLYDAFVAKFDAGCVLPLIPDPISGADTVCAGSTQSYSTNAVAGATSYTWTIPAGANILSGQGTISIIIGFGNVSGNITVSAINTCGAGPQQSKNVIVETCTGMQELNTIHEKYLIYPNPANRYFFIKCNNSGDEFENMEIKIFNVSGKPINFQNQYVSQNNVIKTNVSDFVDGIYLIKISIKQTEEFKKLIVRHQE